jgi:hypothetical protein
MELFTVVGITATITKSDFSLVSSASAQFIEGGGFLPILGPNVRLTEATISIYPPQSPNFGPSNYLKSKRFS